MAECSLGVNDGKLYFVVVIPRGFLASSCFRNIYFFVVCNFIVFVSSSDVVTVAILVNVVNVVVEDHLSNW